MHNFVPEDGYVRPTQRVTTPASLDKQIADAVKQANELVGKSPLAGGRNAPPSIPTRQPNHLTDRETSFRERLHPASTLRAGAAGVYHRDPSTGRTRPSRHGDDPLTLFEMR